MYILECGTTGPLIGLDFCACSTVCCLNRFFDQYTTLQEFGDYISDASLPLQSAIDDQGACTGLDSPPSNHTTSLLSTSHDFVNGSFARMARSYSRIDPTVTRGYQDILLYLALEDVRNLAAVRTELVSPTGEGDRLRFFVGMAHIKTLESDRLAVSSSQVEINADITTSYVYTTKTHTEFTFVRDVGVQLREVRRAGTLANSTTAKFATITVIVPETVTAEYSSNIIPPLSLRVGVGYLANLVTNKTYPCKNTYQGDNQNTIDTLLEDQSYCALQDPICRAQGPVAVGPGGSIQFTFPLEDTVWSAADLADDARLRQSLFIDFMVSVIDKDGKRLVTNLQTSTVLQRSSILSMCTDTVELESRFTDLVTVDVFLGLVGRDEDFDRALVKNEDVTGQANPQNMRSDISSKASNVMTVLVKGAASTFDEAHAREYTLAVEDIITMHFLNADKVEDSRQLMDSGAAFTLVPGADSELSTVKLVPSDYLLELCPLEAIAGRYGCVSRREVTARTMDSRATSIVNIAPNDGTDLFNVSTKAGAWTSNLLGGSEYATQLGFNHSSIMNERYHLNARYRRGFMISPTNPWRTGDLETAEIDSMLDLAQVTMTVILMSIDANINDVYESTVPGGMPRSSAGVRRLASIKDNALPASGPVSRLLMAFDSATSQTAATTETLPQKASIITREIASVRNNDNVVQAVCGNRPDPSKCGMMRLVKNVPIAQFCQSETDIILQMQSDVDLALQQAFQGDLTSVHITSIAQPNRINTCNPQVRRRMLATNADLIFTLVLEVDMIRDTYKFDESKLGAQMITSIVGLTNRTYFQVCGGITNSEVCAEAIAEELTTMRDIVLEFSLDNPSPQIAFDHHKFTDIVQAGYGTGASTAMSTPIHVAGNSTEFYVTISVPFLNVYADEIITTVKNNLSDNNFSLQDTVRHEVVLDMNASSVTAAVQTKVQGIVAMQYGVGVHKIQSTVHNSHSAAVANTTTTLTIMVKTLRERGDVSDFSKYSITQPTHEMVTKIDAALVLATYKDVQKDQNKPNDPANSAETTIDSSIGNLLLWLLIALLLIVLMALVLFIVMGFGICTRQNTTMYAHYNTVQTVAEQKAFDMNAIQASANLCWHHPPTRY